MHKAKRANVQALAAPERFAYFARKVADLGEVWGLFSNGWAMAESLAHAKVMPVWPEAEFAAACATDTWAGYQPKAIQLGDFTSKWVPGMTKDEVFIGVFPTSSDRGVVVEPKFLADALVAEAAQYD